MVTLIEKVKEKINKKLEPEQLTLIDNSILHAKHKSFEKILPSLIVNNHH